jgi:UDP-N-acetylglucosamine 2-epimerase (non-hydrolysing)
MSRGRAFADTIERMPDTPSPSRDAALHIMLCCGARPNFMKIASLLRAFRASPRVQTRLVHTGQHFDDNMSRRFFDDLQLPLPDVNLGCTDPGHAGQTADIMQRFEPIVESVRPDWLVVVGDVTSTLACALVAAKLAVPIAHVEAGLRSFDRSMPEEINRLLTDRLSDLLFVTEPAGMKNLAHEGIPADRCHLVGDTMADTLLANLPRARLSDVCRRLGVADGPYVVATIHRPANVDNAESLAQIARGIGRVARTWPVLFPVHPRTRRRLEEFGVDRDLATSPGVRCVEPLGYLDFLCLLSSAALVMTDSGGIQEETTILGVPCLTLRETTERPYTLQDGSNRLVKPLEDAIAAAFEDVRRSPRAARLSNPLADGRAGERIARIIVEISQAGLSKQ